MQGLVRSFVPVADEVSRLQRGRDAESRLFQSFCEEGHYGGRTAPSSTRQGIYAVAPGGAFLASCNTRDAARVAAMLREALDAWQALPDERRRLGDEQKKDLADVQRFEAQCPEDGLVLEVTTRDLDRDGELSGWHADAWNRDQAWFLEAEARSFLPDDPEPGAVHDVPAALVERIARLHLVDDVRGQTPPFQKASVERAELRTEVLAVDGEKVTLRLRGATRCTERGKWPVRGFRDRERAQQEERERGFRTDILGRATFDLKAGRFVAFEMLAVGERWGGTQFNGRGRDLAPTEVGVAFTLAPPGLAPVAPAFYWQYGW